MTRLNLYAKTGRFDNDDYIKFLKDNNLGEYGIL